MSDRMHTFEVSDAPRIDVRIRSGDVTIQPSDGKTVTVTLTGNAETVELTSVDATNDSVSVRSGSQRQRWFSRSMDVLITAPPGGSVRINLGTGDVVVRIPLVSLDVSAGAGDVQVDEEVAEIRVKVASGDITIHEKVRDASFVSASGDIRVQEVGDIVVNTASGSIDLGAVTSTARIKSASGDLKLHEFSGSDLNVTTMSGDSTIGIAPGMTIDAKITAMSGEFRNRIKPSKIDKTHRMSLTAKSFSGDVTLRKPW
jgi:DUF4097 and DUF4098 domain-containing protein YvlB